MNLEKNTTSVATNSTSAHSHASASPTGGSATGAVATRVPRALTDREKQTLRLVCDGLSNAMIASRLGISPETTKSELKRIFRKIEVKNRTQAAVLLVRQGLV